MAVSWGDDMGVLVLYRVAAPSSRRWARPKTATPAARRTVPRPLTPWRPWKESQAQCHDVGDEAGGLAGRDHRLVSGAFELGLTLLTVGWDCVAVDVDDRLIFKFPRHAAAAKALVSEASLLRVIRPAVTMPVPDLTLYSGPPLFSRHIKLKGEHLLTRQYDLLPLEPRQRLATEMAVFYAELHGLDARDMEAAGAAPIKPWLRPEEILRRAWPVLPPELRLYAERTVSAWQQLPADPYGTTYGFFDGHGWSMAFDHTTNRLNGVYATSPRGSSPNTRP